MNYYSRYYRSLLKGERRTPRGLPVSQQLNQSLIVPPCTTFKRNRDNSAIGFVEGLQFVAGYFDVKQIAAVAPHARLDLFTSQSAYGPRVGDQLEWVVDELKADQDSRRAVIVIADPKEPLADRPCTTSLQFHSGRSLKMTVTIRSSDAVWGLPYDLIQFGLMHAVVGYCVDVPIGGVIVNMGNAHVYDASQVPNAWETWKFTIPPQCKTVNEWKRICKKWAKLSARDLYSLFRLQRTE